MKIYAVIELDTRLLDDLQSSTIRRRLHNLQLLPGTKIVSAGLVTGEMTESSISEALSSPLLSEYHIKVTDDISVDVIAVDVDDAIRKTLIIIDGDPNLTVHNKPDWWTIEVRNQNDEL